VNDHYVLKAWAESMKDAKSKITFLADPDAAFVKSLGLDVNLGAAGLGHRSKRYFLLTSADLPYNIHSRFTIVVNDGKITHENVEKSPAEYVPVVVSTRLILTNALFSFSVTSADVLLKQLKSS
jgi:peroxiredoxin